MKSKENTLQKMYDGNTVSLPLIRGQLKGMKLNDYLLRVSDKHSTLFIMRKIQNSNLSCSEYQLFGHKPVFSHTPL